MESTGIHWIHWIIAALGLWILTWIFVGRKSRLAVMVDKIPGPKGNFIFGNALQLLVTPEGIFPCSMISLPIEFIPKFIQRFGGHLEEGIARSWMCNIPFILLFKSETIEPILSSQENITKGLTYKFLTPWIGLGLLTSTGGLWQSRRKLLTPAFHFRILDDFVPSINDHSKTLVEKLQTQLGKENFNIFPFITLCTLDIICSSTMGCDINAQSQGNSEYTKAIYKICDIIYLRSCRPWIFPDFTFKLSHLGREHDKCLKILHDFTRKVIAERKAEYKNRIIPNEKNAEEFDSLGRKKQLAFLDLLLEYSKGGELLSDDAIQNEVDTFMFEGHDTTSAGIYWCLYLLGYHPEIQQKVYEEINNVVGDSRMYISPVQLRELKYLECVIKEAQRLRPSVPFIQRHLTEDVKIGKYTAPAGANITICTYFVHRDPRYFPFPETFDPSRFLPENSQGRPPYAYVPFSAGPRNCIGQKFALMEEKIVIAHILQRFKITSLGEYKTHMATPQLVLRPTSSMVVKIEPRK